MNRGFRALISVLLAAVYAAVAVPVGLNLAQAEWGAPAAPAAAPPAQQVPSSLSGPGTTAALTDAAPMPDPKLLAGVLDKALEYLKEVLAYCKPE